MRDVDVRSALHDYLYSAHAHELDRTRFVDELDLCGQVRVDVAVINGQMSGYELKSERDTLRRLPTQIDLYSRVLDSATLVVADRHADHARMLVPEWWGVYIATWSSGKVQLEVEAEPQANPNVKAEDVVCLLWRSEVVRELEARDAIKGFRSNTGRSLASRLVDLVSLDELREIVRETLKHREGWRVDR